MDSTTYGALGQPGVGFIMAIIIGAIAGWLAEKFTRSDMGLLMNIVMGSSGLWSATSCFGFSASESTAFWATSYRRPSGPSSSS
jgi:uncharacterized membrane protein YeaQ/YmgE (transglycosylase-associated protein family)